MAYNAANPADTQTIAAGPADIRTNFEGLRTGQIVDAGALKGLVPGNATGNIPVANATICTNLNAEKVGGLLAAAFALVAHVHAAATASSSGFMSNTDFAKLAAIAAGAEVNQMAFSNLLANGVTIQADSATDTLEIVAGTGIALTPDAANDRLTILLAAGAALANLGYTPLNKAGDTLTGALTLAADPTLALHPATKQYVDAVIQQLAIKSPVRVATTANITLSGPQTIDGVAVVVGDRVLVKNQSIASQNGIYVVAASNWSRSTDADSAAKLPAAYVLVREGTTLADTAWLMTTDGTITLDTTALTFTQFQNALDITASGGLQRVGKDISVIPGTTLNANAATATKFADGKNSSSFAPSGFGLGTLAPSIAHPTDESLTQTGIWTLNDGSNYWTVNNISSDANNFCQQTHDTQNNDLHIRSKFNGTLQAWKKMLNVVNGIENLSTGNRISLRWNGSQLVVRVDSTDFPLATGSGYDSAHSFATNGYQKLANGLIFQWGKVSFSGGGSSTVTFPVAFSSAVYFLSGNPYNYTIHPEYLSLSQFTRTGAGDSESAGVFYWFAVGV